MHRGAYFTFLEKSRRLWHHKIMKAIRKFYRFAGWTLILLETALMSGCIPGDAILVIGKWASTTSTVDFQWFHYQTVTQLSFGEITISGKYTTDTDKNPKEINFTPKKVSYRFTTASGELSETLTPGLPWDRAESIFQKGMALVKTPEDLAAMHKLRAHLEALASEKPLEGIYEIEIDYGTYLRYSYNLPGEDRPWAFYAGYVEEEY